MTNTMIESTERRFETVEPKLVLRTTVHGAPTNHGLLIIGPGGALTIGGGRAAHVLWERLEQVLRTGVRRSELERAVPPAAQGALGNFIDQLTARGFIIDDEQMIGTEPSDTLASTPANLHAYLDAVAPAPRHALNLIRTAEVSVTGHRDVVEKIHRVLGDFGVEPTVASIPDKHIDPDHPLRVDVAFPDRTDREVGLTVVIHAGAAVVGPVGPVGSSASVVDYTIGRIDPLVLRSDGHGVPGLVTDIVAALVAQAIINTIAGATDYSDDQVRIIEASRLRVTVHPRPALPSAAAVRPRAADEYELDRIEMDLTDPLTGIAGTPSPWTTPQGAVAVAAATSTPPWTPTVIAGDGHPGRNYIAETLEEARRNALMASIAEALPDRPDGGWKVETGQRLDRPADLDWQPAAGGSLEEFLRNGIVALLLAHQGRPSGADPIELGSGLGLWVSDIAGVTAVADSRQALLRLEDLASDRVPDGGISWVGSDEAVGHQLAAKTENLAWAQLDDPELRTRGVVAGWVGQEVGPR